MKVKITEISPRALEVASVCIVRFAAPIALHEVVAGKFFQVTLDPAAYAGDFVRLGADGDELVGWQPLDFLCIVHVIAERSDDGQFRAPIEIDDPPLGVWIVE